MDKAAEMEQIREELRELRSRVEAAEARLTTLENGPSEEPARKQLRDYIVEVLENSNEPLTAKEIAELLAQTDYTSRALRKHWPTMILQCLASSPEFKRASRYRSRPTRYALAGQD